MIAFVFLEISCARRSLFIRRLCRFFHEVRWNLAEVHSRPLRLVAEFAKLEQTIKVNLRGVGHGG